MATPNGVSFRSLKICVRLLLLVHLSASLMVEIKGLNEDYSTLRNANGIIKTSHIQSLDGEEDAHINKENVPLADLNNLTPRLSAGVERGYNDFALNDIRQAPAPNPQDGNPKQPQEKMDRFEKSPASNLNMNINNNEAGVPGSSAPGVCHMDIEYKLTKRVLGHCTNLGRSARGCIAGNYLQIYHPACL